MEKYIYVNENKATELKKLFTDILLSIQKDISSLGKGGFLIRIVGSSKYNFIIDYKNNNYQIDFQALFESKLSSELSVDIRTEFIKLIQAELIKRNLSWNIISNTNHITFVNKVNKNTFVYNLLILKKTNDVYFINKKAQEGYFWSEVNKLTQAFEKFAKDEGKHIRAIRNNFWDKKFYMAQKDILDSNPVHKSSALLFAESVHEIIK